MQYTRLGNTGLKVSRLCLGMMTYGSKQWRPWAIEENDAQPFLRQALEAGINFFDTADVYSLGRSEEILGNAIREFGPGRDRVVLATPGKLAWLLHAEHTLTWDKPTSTATIIGAQRKSSLTAQLLSANLTWRASQTDQFPVPVDPKYATGEVNGAYLTGKWTPQQHLTLESNESAAEFTLYSVLWPERGAKPAPLAATLAPDGILTIPRPDGKTDRLSITGWVRSAGPDTTG